MITEKQKRAIAFIENQLEIKFKGTTFEEAFKFIGDNLSNAQFCANMDKAIGSIGVTMFSAKHKKGEIDEVITDYKDTLAEDKFKGRILRGTKPIDALMKLQEEIVIDNIKENSNANNNSDN